MNKKTLSTIIAFILILSLSKFVYAYNYYGYYDHNHDDDDDGGGGFLDDIFDQENVIEMPWYDVEPWELEACRIWGGTEDVESTSSGNTVYVSQLTITLQGQKTEYDIDGYNSTIYEVGWYIQPLQNSTSYAVRLYNPSSGSKHSVKSKTEIDQTGESGYEAYELDETFTVVQMRFDGSDGSGVLTMPIVDSENGYTQQVTGMAYGFSTGSGDWPDW